MVAACRTVSWSIIEQCAGTLAERVVQSGGRPDCILAVLRGGLVPARLLSDLLALPLVLTVAARAYDRERRLDRVRIGPLPANLSGRRVLVVDDIFDSGNTLQEVMRRLPTRRPAAVTMATLLARREFPALCYGRKVGPDTWFIFPWEKQEMTHLLEQAKPLRRAAPAAAAAVLEGGP